MTIEFHVFCVGFGVNCLCRILLVCFVCYLIVGVLLQTDDAQLQLHTLMPADDTFLMCLSLFGMQR